MTASQPLRWFLPSLAVVAFMAAGCGSSGDEETTQPTTAPPAAQTGSAQTEPGYKALNTLKEDGAAAAAGLAGVTEEDLNPGEDAAELVLERGHIDRDQFCSSIETAVEAGATTQAEAAFEAGWQENASPELSGRGGSIFKALAVACQPT